VKTEGIGSLSQPRKAGKKTGQPILDAISHFNRIAPEAVRKGLGDWRFGNTAESVKAKR
jgi:hypothetical protein